METPAHNQLKRLAVTFLRHWGCHAVSTEVSCPIARFRVDVAGWLDRAPADVSAKSIQEVIAKPQAATGKEKNGSRTVMIECKQVRSDYLRDGKETEKLLRRREQLTRIRKSIEEHRVKLLEPHLCQTGTALFSEFDEWDFSESKLPSYQSVSKALERVDEALHGQTKFSTIARYHLADYLYIAAPRNMIRPREVPPGWGLLECPDTWLCGDGATLFEGPQLFEVRVPAPLHESKLKRKMRLLRNIAVSASYKALPG